MASLEANGITIEYQIEGNGPPLLMVMGLGGQLTDWHRGFVDLLARDFTVITYDNRDSGLSSSSKAPSPSRWQLVKANLWPGWVQPAYHLSDMADDAVALLDGLAIPRAHILGMSMGGMIAQLVAIRHPARALTLCSIMSNTGDRINGRPTVRVVAELARRRRPSRDEALRLTIDLTRLVAGDEWDPHEQQQRTSASIARAYNPAGVLRQSIAIAAANDRTKDLRTLDLPTLVIHGLADPLVRPSGGIATARATPDARLLMFPGMGHDLPVTRHGEIVDAIHRNTLRVARQRS